MSVREKPRRGCMGNLVRGGGLLILGLIVCGVIAQFAPDREEPTTRGQPVVDVVATFTPTTEVEVSEPILVPTDTPAIAEAASATDTPAPAATATTAPTEAPAVDPELVAYVNGVMGPMENINGAMRAMAELTSNPQPNSEQWIIRVGGMLAVFRLAHEELTELQPPALLADTHAKLTEATAQCDAMTYSVSQGIDDRDVALLRQGIEQLNQCNSLMTEATALLQTAMQP